MHTNTEDIQIRNIMVRKDKVSNFIKMYQDNDILKDCAVLRILPSGNYHIYTFRIDRPEQKQELKNIQDEWI